MDQFSLFPYKTSSIDEAELVTNDAGGFFITSKENVHKLGNKDLSSDLKAFLLEKNFGYLDKNSLEHSSFTFTKALRRLVPNKLKYIIIVPTLRCDLKCSYCQVSRADINATGFDWDDETITNFINFVEENADEELKIEFQGGEPTLRLDLVRKVIEKITQIRPLCLFVICTNLQTLSDELMNILENKNVQISTSFDGSLDLHTAHRTENKGTTNEFIINLKELIAKVGLQRVSALPTISNFDKIEEVINGYKEIGMNEIFLRPVNNQGFARKKHRDSAKNIDSWIQSYLKAIDFITDYNDKNANKIIETNLSLHLKRVFQPGNNSHVDLRSPNPAAKDYLVVDFDGAFYPTDESRMLTRIGLIDLRIGSLTTGIDLDKVSSINFVQDNMNDRTCNECSLQPFCGVYAIDKISRYQTVNHPTHETYFCQFHMAVFKKIFNLFAKKDVKFLKNASLHLGGDYALSPALANLYYD